MASSVELTRCDYVVVRYVQDIVRDEPVNIGIVLQAPGIYYADCLFAKKLRAVLPRTASPLDLRVVQAHIEAFQKMFRDTQNCQRTLLDSPAALSESFLGQLHQRYSSGRIRITEPRTSLATDPMRELTELFGRFVSSSAGERIQGVYHSPLRNTLRKDFERLQILRKPNTLNQNGLQEDLLVFGTKSGAPQHVQFARQNGVNVLVETVNLRQSNDRLRNRDAAAAAYKFQDIRAGNSAVMTYGYAVVSLENSSKIHVAHELQQLRSEAIVVNIDDKTEYRSFIGSLEKAIRTH